MVLIAPSLLAADVASLGKEVEKLEKAKADFLHFDVMDGHFVPNITYGPHILKGLKGKTSVPFDVHLMVNEPERFVPWFIDAGADIVTFHLEATKNPDALIHSIKKAGIKAGISLKPKTDMSILKNLTETPALILVMGVEPGFGGQKFFPDTPKRIEKTKKLFPHTLIEVDGGIAPDTAQLCIDAGADILVAGTFIFKKGTYAKNINALKGDTL